MPRNFTLVKKTKQNECDAMRCQAPPTNWRARNGTKFCARHIGLLAPDEFDVLGGGDPLPDNEDVKSKDGFNEHATKAEIEPYRNDALSLVEKLDPIVINDAETADMMGVLLKEYHDHIKIIEAKRKEATKPLTEAKRAIDSWFKPARTALEEAKKLLKNKIADWAERQELARQEALDSGDVERALNTPEAAIPDTAMIRKFWTFEVTDLPLVPAKFLIVDADAIKNEMEKAGPENTVIPGIRIFQTSTVTVKGKRSE
jgi:hypothetical protein